MRLDRSTFEEVVANISDYRDSSGAPLNMVSLAASNPSHYFEAQFVEPSEQIVDIRSVSKAFVAGIVGVAIQQRFRAGSQELSLDMPVWPLLQTAVTLRNRRNEARLQRVKLLHLLTHTMGQANGILFSSDIEDVAPDDLLEYAVNTDLEHDPGTHYAYSNVGPYLVSVLLQIGTGRTLLDLCHEHLFGPLGIVDVTWKSYGDYTAGCTGLRLRNSDLHKLGRCFADEGQYNGLQVVPRNWIHQMRKLWIHTPKKYDASRVFPKYGYGLLSVVTRDGIYYQDGADSQYLICMPEQRIVVSTTARQHDNVPVTEAMRPFLAT